ncbi:MAG TPA: metallophosphoesterase [Kofleriaceae bacterium]|nr:metallophosphoesterase [Kofleriaceae bacterium]
MVHLGAHRTASAEESAYIAPGAAMDWVALRAPLAAEQLGVIAAGEVGRVRAAADGAAAVPQAELFGEVPVEAPADGWQGAALPGAAHGPAPLGARTLDGRCECATEIGDQRTERVAALYAQTTFAVGAELPELRGLELRVRFSDGLVAWINGHEVARRAVARDDGRMDPVDRPAGPEWETFYLPVSRDLLRRGENRLSIEVRPHRQERAPVLDLALFGHRGARVVRGPQVAWTSPTAAVISFDTDLPSRGAVKLTAGGEEREAVSARGALAVHHRVELRDLPAASAVRYRVVTGGDVTAELDFRTAPAAGAPVRFAVYGDMRGGHRTHARIVEALLEEAPDFVVVTGDMVLRGTDEGGWQKFFEITRDLIGRIPYYPAAGNHDMGTAGDEARRMNEIFPLPAAPARPAWAHWYSFDVAGVHVVMLDSNAYEHQAQLDWLKADLAAARAAGARAIFAAVHDGPYSRGNHGGSAIARERYVPLLTGAGVVMLFAGHDHIYQRGEAGGLRYIVSGGGGAPLYAQRCGVRGKPRCDVADGLAKFSREHHYVMVTVQGDHAEVCARRPDRTLLEKCQRIPLAARPR